MTEITSDQLVYMLGRKQLEIEFLKAENDQLTNRVRTLEVAAEVRKGEAHEEGD